MKLATFKTAQGQSYGIVTGKGIVDLKRYLGNQYADLKSLIAGNAFPQAVQYANAEPDYQASDVTWLPVIPNPDKIVCVGLNYQEHVVETGRDNTEQPAIFLRLPESQVGHKQPIVRPRESKNLDYEAEIAVIIGTPGRRISQKDAWSHVAGYCIVNDVSERAFQMATTQWDKGKGFDTSGPIGPWLVTADEVGDPQKLDMLLEVNGKKMQSGNTRTMVFSVAKIIAHVSQYMTLMPGDIIATGTPPGVGLGIKPNPVFLKPGDVMRLTIAGLGEQKQRVVAYSA